MQRSQQLLDQLYGREPQTSRQLQSVLAVSQPTVSRLLRQAGERIARIGNGRGTRYAMIGDLHGLGSALPLFAIGEQGVAKELGSLRLLSSGQYLVEGDDRPPWVRGATGDGVFASLPYYLDDLRPSGFLGQLKSRALAREWGFPPDPRLWRSAHTLRYLTARGHDSPGNLLLGHTALEAALRGQGPVVRDRAREFPELASHALGDEPVGSSAGGEQPKFAIRLASEGHVIVKFSPASRGREARRWRDLLRAESLAQATLSRNHIPAAVAEVCEFEGRVFLHSRRFDRVGQVGRMASLSLAAVDAEFIGEGQGWTRCATALHAQGLLDAQSLRAIAWAELFGLWIGNSDMHLGNVSLRPTSQGFCVLPIYDMLPMALAPVRGDLPRPVFRPPILSAPWQEYWFEAGRAAVRFWQELADDDSVHGSLRDVAGQRARDVARLVVT